MVAAGAVAAAAAEMVARPVAGAMALVPASAQDRSAVLPYIVVVYLALLLVIGVYHYTTGYFVLDPARARVVNDGREIPFEDLRVPRITTETSLGVGGEFGELVQEEQGAVLKSGTHVFFHQGLFRRRVLEKVANALNDAIREHDEREAIRRWLEREGQRDE